MVTIKKYEVFESSLDEFGTPMQEGEFKGYFTVIKIENVLELINKRLKDYSERLKNKHLPELTQANLSGMILALEEIKSKIQ